MAFVPRKRGDNGGCLCVQMAKIQGDGRKAGVDVVHISFLGKAEVCEGVVGLVRLVFTGWW